MKVIPERMCIACRKRLPKTEMLRIVRNKEGQISLDFGGKKAGRGAYICDSAECIKKCHKTNLLSRVFEQTVELEVYEAINNQYATRKD